MGEKSHRAATSGPVFHPDNALRAQRGTEAMDHFHWPSQFCTLGPFLLMCLDGQDAMFMFFSRSVHLAWATWLMLPVRNEWSRVELQCGSHLAVLQVSWISLGRKELALHSPRPVVFQEHCLESHHLKSVLQLPSPPPNHMPAASKHPCPEECSSGHPHRLFWPLWLIPTGYLGGEKGVSHSWAVGSRSLPWSRVGYCRVTAVCVIRRFSTGSNASPGRVRRGWRRSWNRCRADKKTHKQKSLSYYTESSQSVFIHRQHDHLYIKFNEMYKKRRLSGHEFEQTLGDSEGQWSPVCCSPWGHKESRPSNWKHTQSY